MVVTVVTVVREVMATACQLNEAQILLVPVFGLPITQSAKPKPFFDLNPGGP